VTWWWAPWLLSIAASACTVSPGSVITDVVALRVIDGDTLDVRLGDGSRERIRLIGIDTPESVIPGREPECFGPESARRLTELAPPGTPLRLERDVEARDPYGRLLAYVYVNDDMVNLTLAHEGFAEAMSIPPNTAWSSRFSAAVARAKAQRSGMWAVCAR
jgi:micrococcal nuclease